jgi:hypothetical protein
MRSLCWLGLAIVLTAGCAKEGSLVVITLDSTPAIEGIARVHAAATAGTSTHELDIPFQRRSMRPIPASVTATGAS